MESFILRLFREGNSHGCITALSDSPESFVRGFSHIEKTMKALYVRKLHLWPRFHLDVSRTLSQHRPSVIELYQPLTPLMKGVQDAIVEVIDACIIELKHDNKIDLAEVTTDTALTKAFDVLVRKELLPIWHRVSPKSKQLVSDLGTLRQLLTHLVCHDCITFYRFLSMVRAEAKAHLSLWLYTDAANRLFKFAKERIYVIHSDSDGKQGDLSSKPTSKVLLCQTARVRLLLLSASGCSWRNWLCGVHRVCGVKFMCVVCIMCGYQIHAVSVT